MICIVCNKGKAIKDPVLGVLPCTTCQNRRRKNSLPDMPHEFVGESIHRERQDFAKSIVQPFNRQGTFSDEYYQAYGTKGVKVTPEQIKKRARIWDKTISLNTDITKTK